MQLTNLPNTLTFLRISIVPLFMLAFYLPINHQALILTIIFAIAALTDWLDGFLARRLHQVSPIGAFLDPVADKLIVVVALVLLVESYTHILISLSAALIICREIAVSALREWMAGEKLSSKVAVSWLGKVKTCTQMLAILLLISQLDDQNEQIEFLGIVFLLISVFLSLLSMLQYFVAAKNSFKSKKT